MRRVQQPVRDAAADGARERGETARPADDEVGLLVVGKEATQTAAQKFATDLKPLPVVEHPTADAMPTISPVAGLSTEMVPPDCAFTHAPSM